MEKNVINDLNLSKTTEQPQKKRRRFSASTLAMILTTWSLLFSSCSNQESPQKDYEQRVKTEKKLQQKIATQDKKINESARIKAHYEGQRKVYAEKYHSAAIQYLHKRAECFHLLEQQPNATEKLAYNIHSAQQLYNAANERKMKVKELDNKIGHADKKSTDDTAEKEGLTAELEVIQESLNSNNLLLLLPPIDPDLLN